jgi:CheY-like chemotaxis protein/DNA-directed RNA polymerase specialized sigma24 family protein
MKTATAIAEFLPYLRRYARALLGSQAAGDAAVLGFLQGLVDDEAALRSDVAPRIAVYRAFHAHRDVWRPQDHGVDARPTSGGAAVEVALTRLASSNREALLLNAMEGFSIDETAVVLGASTEAVRGSIEAALAEIRDQARARVLVIEDEPIIALDLKNILEGMGHEVVGTAATRDEAVALANELAPGLVLADIRLADGSSGIDAVRMILSDFTIPIIFVTAYPERLLTGDRPEPAFLVTKPFAAETIRATVGQALLFS